MMGAPRCPSRSRGECPTASLPQDFGVRCRPRTAPSGAPLCRPLRDRREGPRGTLCTPDRPQRRPASSPIPQPGAGRRLSWAGQRRRVPPLAALPLSGWGRPGRLSPGSHFSSLGAWWRRERGRVSPAGRGPEAAAGAERSRSAQEAPGSGHCSQEVRRRRRSCARGREGGSRRKRERSGGSAPFIARKPAGRQPWDGTGRDGTGRDGTGRDGTGRGGTRRKPAGARIAPRSSGDRGRLLAPSPPFPRGGGGNSSSGFGAPWPSAGRDAGEGERQPEGSALLPRARTHPHEVPADGSPSLAAGKGEVRRGRLALLRTCSCFPAPFYPLLLKGLRGVLFLGSLSERERRARRAHR